LDGCSSSCYILYQHVYLSTTFTIWEGIEEVSKSALTRLQNGLISVNKLNTLLITIEQIWKGSSSATEENNFADSSTIATGTSGRLNINKIEILRHSEKIRDFLKRQEFITEREHIVNLLRYHMIKEIASELTDLPKVYDEALYLTRKQRWLLPFRCSERCQFRANNNQIQCV